MSAVFHIDAAYLTYEEYARRVGLTAVAVRQQAEKGLLPTFEQKMPGKERGKRYINNALLIKQALEGGQ